MDATEQQPPPPPSSLLTPLCFLLPPVPEALPPTLTNFPVRLGAPAGPSRLSPHIDYSGSLWSVL